MEDDIQQRLELRQFNEAFELLLERFKDKVFRLAFSILHNETLAEDAAQDAFVRIWKGLPGYHGGASLSTWIYAITRNTCLTELKRRELEQLDDILSRTVQVPTLATGFTSKLSERIQLQKQPLSQAERAEHRRRLQVEFEQGMALLLRQTYGWGSLRQIPACALLMVIAGFICWGISPLLVQSLGQAGRSSYPATVWLGSAAALLGIWLLVFPRQFKRFWLPAVG